jgi:hypothetical protein
VKEPLLEPEALSAFLEVNDFVIEEAVESYAGGIGTVVVEGIRASLPMMTRGQATKTLDRAPERNRSFAEHAGHRELQPGCKELIVCGRFARLKRPRIGRKWIVDS